MGCHTSSEAQILVLIGSVRKNSNNRGLVQSLIKTEEFKSLGFHTHAPDLSELPIFNEDLQKQKSTCFLRLEIPSSVTDLRKLCSKSQAVLFVTPEYNGSVAPALKNAYDWLSRKDPDFDNKSVIADKFAAILSTSYIGQTQVKDCEKMGEFLKLRYFSKPYYVNLGSKFFDEKGQLKDDNEKKKIVAWGADFAAWMNQNK